MTSGGMAMNLGANFQAEVAAFLAVLALSEDTSQYREELGGVRITRIGAEQSWPLDDLVVWLDSGAMGFIQVKSSLTSSDEPNSTYAQVIDQVTLQALHGRGREPGEPLRSDDRLLLIVGQNSSKAIKSDLRDVLHRVRSHPRNESLLSLAQKQAPLETQLSRVASLVERKLTTSGATADDANVRNILEHFYVLPVNIDDVRDRARLLLSNRVLREETQVEAAFALLTRHFAQAAQHRTSHAVDEIRRMLRNSGILLREPPSIAEDVARLVSHTRQTITAETRKITAPEGDVLVPRAVVPVVLSLLSRNNVVVTAEAGAGKSGVLLEIASALRNRGERVVFLDAADPTMADPTSALHLTRPLEEVLDRWGDQDSLSYLLIDGFDSLRLGVAFDHLLRLLRRINALGSRWRVAIASREYDLLHGVGQLTRLFPHDSEHEIDERWLDKRFRTISHVVVRELDNDEIKNITSQSATLRQLLRTVPAAVQTLLRNPFNLSLAADLAIGVPEAPDLSDIRDRKELLDLWWDCRVSSGASWLAKESNLRSVARAMVSTRQLRVPVEIAIDTAGPLNELLSAGVLVHPDPYRLLLAYRHALIFDYAVNRLLLSSPGELAQLLSADRDAFLFILPSIRWHFASLWNTDRVDFYDELTTLFNVSSQRRTLLMVAANIAFERITHVGDVSPLLERSDRASDAIVRNIVRSLIYARENGLSLVGDGGPWSDILLQMAHRLPQREHDTLLLLSEVAKGENASPHERTVIAEAARLAVLNRLSAPHYNQIFMRMALVAFMQHYDVDPRSAEPILQRFLAPERIAAFGHLELEPLTYEVKHVHDVAALKAIYSAVFSNITVPDEKVQLGAPSVLMGFVQDGRQSLSMARWALAQRFPQFLSEHPRAAVRVLLGVINTEAHEDLTRESWLEVPFHGKTARLLRDISNVWDSDVYHHENWFTMAGEFEKALRSGLGNGDTTLLQAALEELTSEGSPAFLWRVLLRNADASPEAALILAPLLFSKDALLTYELREPIATYLEKAYILLPDEHRESIDDAILALGEVNESEAELRDYHQRLQRVYITSIPRSSLADDRLRSLVDVVPDGDSNSESTYDREMTLSGHVMHGATVSRIKLSEAVCESGGSQELVDAIDAVEQIFYAGNATNAVDASAIAPAIRLINSMSAEAAPAVRENVLDILAAFIRIGLERNAFSDADRSEFLETLLIASYGQHPEVQEGRIAEHEQQFAGHPSWGSPAARTDAVQALWLIYEALPSPRVLEAIERLASDPDPAVRFLAVQRAFLARETDVSSAWRLVDRGVTDANISVSTAGLRAAQYLANTNTEHYLSLFYAAIDRFVLSQPKAELSKDLLRWQLERVIQFDDGESRRRLQPMLSRPWLYAEHIKHLAFLLANAISYPLEQQPAVANLLSTFVDALLERVNRYLDTYGGDVSSYPDDERRETYSNLETLKEVAERIYFASGRLKKTGPSGPLEDTGTIDPARYKFIEPTLRKLADLKFSGTAYYVIKTLGGIVEELPKQALLLAAEAVRNGVAGGLAQEYMAEDDVRDLVQRYIDFHRGLLEQDCDCLAAIMDIIDAYVDAGWPKWIDIIFQLDRIYREE